MTTNNSTRALIECGTASVTLPVPLGARRVRMSIKGSPWTDGSDGPTPALIECRLLGGPPVTRELSPEERSRRLEDGRSTVWSDTTLDLPPGTVGVEVTVKQPTPGMVIRIELRDITVGK